jgi:hypothetical protein
VPRRLSRKSSWERHQSHSPKSVRCRQRHTGWHTHPGPVVVVVASGELTYYRADDPTCTGITYSAGSAFIDPGHGHVHIARNLSASENLELYATYFEVPPGAGSQRIDAPDPGNCTF